MQTPTILIVDDSRMSRMLISAIVADALPDAIIVEANGGEDALEKISAQLDIATIDFNMPGMDGLTLSSKLRERFPDAKLGLVTAHVDDDTQQKSKELGVYFIGKPITEESIGSFLKNNM